MTNFSEPDYLSPEREPVTDPFQTDYRQATRQVLGILMMRRWFFFIPCCVGLTVAFGVSYYIPRRFVAKTVFERRDDPMIAGAFRAGLQSSFDPIRKSISMDLKGNEAIRESLLSLAWAEDLARDESGQLTPDAARKVEDLVRDVAENSRFKFIENSEDLDVVELAYAGEDPILTAKIVNRLRDNYIQRTRERIDRLMRESHSFLDKKVHSVRQGLETLWKGIGELDSGLPEGIEIQNRSAVKSRSAVLRNELEDLRQKNVQLAAKIESRENYLKTGDETAPGLGDIIDKDIVVLNDSQVIKLSQELERVTSKINELQTTRRMREHHPDVRKYVRETERIKEELAQAKEDVYQRLESEGTVKFVESSRGTPSPEYAHRMVAELDSLSTLYKMNEESIVRDERQLAKIEEMAPVIWKRHQSYLDLAKDEENLTASLGMWNKNLISVNRWFEIQDSEKANVFRTLEPARPTVKPFSPRLGTVLVFCLFFGGLMGGSGILLAEIFDSKIRTADQVRNVLGVPIIEQVSEIVTPLVQKKRTLKRMLYQPALALILLGAVLATGLSVYYRLERPGHIVNLISVPGLVYSSLNNALAMGD